MFHFWRQRASVLPLGDGVHELERVHGADEADAGGEDPHLEELEATESESLLQPRAGGLNLWRLLVLIMMLLFGTTHD